MHASNPHRVEQIDPVGTCDPLQIQDVSHSRSTIARRFVTLVERELVTLSKPSSLSLPDLGDERLNQVIVPAADQLGDLTLDELDIHLERGHLGSQKEVEPHLRLVLTDRQLVFDVARPKLVGQEFLNPAPHHRVEPVAWHDHHNGQTAPQRVGARGKANAPFLFETHDGTNLLMQAPGIGPEEFAARHRVEDGADLLVVV